ncbi:MAG: hypothetical protein M3Y60_04560, partial [Bacteroidota bacterium]|nr:hypothetical protein [Bacteroidota bacterium]
MRPLIALITLMLACFYSADVQATTYYTYINGGSSGFWADATTWTTDPSGISLVGSAVPANGDQVIILNGYTVIMNANVSSTGLVITIQNGGALDLRNHT